jgi:RHS repeat-associated protein
MKIQDEYYYYQKDHLGTPQKMTAGNGEVVWSAKYNSFLEAKVDPASTITNNLRAPGQYEDGETSLYYNWHRYYDPVLGRYLRADPIGIKGANNLFLYTEDNPINKLDKDGLKSFKVVISVGGGVGYVVVGGSVMHLEITDTTTGQICMYTVVCIGVGVGLPEINVTSKPTDFTVDDECKECSDFAGNGYIGGISLVFGAGGTYGGGMKIPNGPFIPGKFGDDNYGGFRVGVSHNICRFNYRGRRK